MTDAVRERTKLELLTRMLRDGRAAQLAPLVQYLEGMDGDEAWVAHHYLRLTGRAAGEDEEAPGEPAPGRRQGPYLLVRELGRGGQGTVWQARDERLDRDLALKIVPNPPGASDAGPRFRREAMLAARLEHPAICQVHDAGSDGRVSWIAMRLVEGRTLAEQDEPAPIEVTLARFQVLAEALHTAHDAGVVHRDVKPANVMITPAGEAVLLDFGVARGDDEGAPLTLTGDALGTPAYMSPEQLTGEAKLDGRTDVWSLGVSLFEALTGRRPFEAPTREALIRQILEREPAGLGAGFSRDLSIVVQTALSKELGRRYANAQAFADDLGRVLRGEPVTARPVTTVGRIMRWARREPRFAGSVLAFVVALAIALLALVGALNRTQTTLDERNALLEEVDRTSDQVLVKELLEATSSLLPAHPRLQSELDRWVADADELFAREDEHRTRRARVAVRVAEVPEDRRAWSTDQARDVWLLGQLDELIIGLAELGEALPSMRERATFARELERRTVTEHAAAWARAAENVAADPRFAGLVLEPQLGLIPLGPDPVSGLEEFAHLASGVPAVRGEGGAIELLPETGIVLVLVPGGDTATGLWLEGEGHAAGDPFVVPSSRVYERGVVSFRMEPLLVGKHEVTQSQWERHTGQNPAYYSYGDEVGVPIRPVEQVSFVECRAFVRELDLDLPSEEEWETFARAGTTTPWYFGQDVRDGEGHVNVSDATSKAVWKNPEFAYEEWLNDGFISPAPVGSFLPNAWGLFDVVGNVKEWTTSGWSWPGMEHVPRTCDLPDEDALTRVVRGGSFGTNLAASMSASRRGHSPTARSYQLGFRPIRRLD